MDSAQRQLKSIDVSKFRVVTMGESTWLKLPDEDVQCGGACKCDTTNLHSRHFEKWLKDWNIDQLEELEISPGASFSSRKLKIPEKESFETLRARLLRCKQYALNYYENSIFDEMNE